MKTIKAPAGFELIHKFVVNAENHCVTLLGYPFRKKKIQIILDFIEVRYNIEVSHIFNFIQFLNNTYIYNIKYIKCI